MRTSASESMRICRIDLKPTPTIKCRATVLAWFNRLACSGLSISTIICLSMATSLQSSWLGFCSGDKSGYYSKLSSFSRGPQQQPKLSRRLCCVPVSKATASKGSSKTKATQPGHRHTPGDTTQPLFVQTHNLGCTGSYTESPFPEVLHHFAGTGQGRKAGQFDEAIITVK